MDISREEQRVLHILAQGGFINLIKNERGKFAGVECFNREGWRIDGLTIHLFRKLRNKDAIASRESGPYRITRRGLELVRGQVDNQ